MAGGVVGVLGAGFGVFLVLWGLCGLLFWCLATWWASFWSLEGLGRLLGAQGVLERELGSIFDHFGDHFGRLFRSFWHHFLMLFWRSHFRSLLITF